jgi:hypothetical protein
LGLHLFKREELEHILDWMAYLLQHPDKKINHALLVSGTQGIGKDTFIQPLIYGLGERNVAHINASLTTGGFDDWVVNRKLVVVEEVMNFRKIEMENRFKIFLASPPTYFTVNMKGLPPFEVPNVVQLLYFSNHSIDAISISPGDRRYYCVESEAEALTPRESQDIWKFYKGGGLAAVCTFLRDRDVSEFDPAAPPPVNAFKKSIIQASRANIVHDVEEVIQEHQWQVLRISAIQQYVRGRGVHVRSISNALRQLGWESMRLQWKVEGRYKQSGRVWMPKDSPWKNMSHRELDMEMGIDGFIIGDPT